MEKNLPLWSLNLKVGFFDIKVSDAIIIKINNNDYKALGNHLDFLPENNGFNRKSIEIMVSELKSNGVNFDDKIKKLIESGLFNKSSDYLNNSYDCVAILKGKATNCRSPKRLISEGIPSDFFLVPIEETFSIAYLISNLFSKEFLNILGMDRIFIMSNPLEKFDKFDDDLIVEWDPSYHGKTIKTALYDNPYSGDKNAGYLFFTF